MIAIINSIPNAVNCVVIQGDSFARGPKLLCIKHFYWDNDLKIYIHIPGTMQNRACS
jgi:hypothetical protein